MQKARVLFTRKTALDEMKAGYTRRGTPHCGGIAL